VNQMSIKVRFLLTLLIIVLSLLLVLWFTTSETLVRITPLIPASLSYIAFYLISSKSVFPRIRYVSKYFIIKSISLLANLLAVLLIFLAGFSHKILWVIVYLISYLVLLLHFTYFIVKDRNTSE